MKLILNLFATVVLLMHTRPIGVLAGAAAEGSLSDPQLHSIKIQLVVDAAVAIFVLLVATVLAVYKPRVCVPTGGVNSTDEKAVKLVAAGRVITASAPRRLDAPSQIVRRHNRVGPSIALRRTSAGSVAAALHNVADNIVQAESPRQPS